MFLRDQFLTPDPAEPVQVFFDMSVYVVNSSLPSFKSCVSLTTALSSQDDLGERNIDIVVISVDSMAMGKAISTTCTCCVVILLSFCKGQVGLNPMPLTTNPNPAPNPPLTTDPNPAPNN